MSVDPTAVLTILTLITGVIWGSFVVYRKFIARDYKPKTVVKDDGEVVEKDQALVEFSRFLFPVFLVVLIVRGFLVEPFQIPSGSMMPTLEAGDYILVNKFSYGLRSPLGYYKILDLGSPERGDVVVFRYPEDPDTDYIKRVIGVPGDRISYRDKVIYVNDEPMPIKPIGRYSKDGDYLELQEKLGEVTHDILHVPFANEQPPREWLVPEGHYLVFGDNRDNSRDSRFWGFVPDENLKGRAFMIWFHKKKDEWPSEWSRIGTIIE